METAIIVDYSPRAFAVISAKDSVFSDCYKMIGGKFCPGLQCGPAWIFSKAKHRESVDALFNALGEDVATTESDLQTAIDAGYRREDKPRKGASGSTNTNNGGGELPSYILTGESRRDWARQYGSGQAGEEYHMKHYNIVVQLEGGEYFPIAKEGLNTEFWFGESDFGQGPTSKEAHAAANKARENVDYFISENISHISEILSDLQNGESTHGYGCYLWISQNTWSSKPVNEWHLKYFNLHPQATNNREHMDACDRIEYDAGQLKPLTENDRLRLIEGYKLAYDMHMKRINTYLKKYGLSKVRASVYWMDR